INVLSTSSVEKTKYIQKGIREKLLCNHCEQYFSVIEKYARGILYGGVEIQIAEEKSRILLKDIDYKKLKLFQLSLLWRASVAENDFFSELNTGPHEDILRQMLCARNPGDSYEYGCTMIFYALGEDKLMGELIRQPSLKWIDNHRCYKFVLGGCLWIFVVSKHSRNFIWRELFLTKDGNLTILKKKAKNDQELRKLIGI
ncbi:MAG: hypothetical protein WBD28_07935, partial [Candidatus Zixiibacteriota bacterium]